MLYLDTSVVVSAITPETTTGAALLWLDAQPSGLLAYSPWVTIEVNSALSRKVRNGRITAHEQVVGRQSFQTFAVRHLTDLPITPGHFRAAAEISAQSESGIRAGDAFHLAIAAGHGADLVTFDKALWSGAAMLGYRVTLLE